MYTFTFASRSSVTTHTRKALEFELSSIASAPRHTNTTRRYSTFSLYSLVCGQERGGGRRGQSLRKRERVEKQRDVVYSTYSRTVPAWGIERSTKPEYSTNQQRTTLGVYAIGSPLPLTIMRAREHIIMQQHIAHSLTFSYRNLPSATNPRRLLYSSII